MWHLIPMPSSLSEQAVRYLSYTAMHHTWPSHEREANMEGISSSLVTKTTQKITERFWTSPTSSSQSCLQPQKPKLGPCSSTHDRSYQRKKTAETISHVQPQRQFKLTTQQPWVSSWGISCHEPPSQRKWNYGGCETNQTKSNAGTIGAQVRTIMATTGPNIFARPAIGRKDTPFWLLQVYWIHCGDHWGNHPTGLELAKECARYWISNRPQTLEPK
jgi:hypothetical protein